MPKDNKDFFISKNIWSEIKDRLLGGYLPQYFQKLLASRRPIYYVDCFAGKGKFNDGSDGSPRVALKVRDECLARTKEDNAKISTCFIDLNYARELRENTHDFHRNGAPIIISGRYEEQIGKLLANKKEHNVFLYIDPYGIRALDYNLFESISGLGLHSIEMLINMNTFGFFRDACRAMNVDRVQRDAAFRDLDDFIIEYEPTEVDDSEQSASLLTRIAGGDYWKAIVRDYYSGVLDGYDAEKRFSIEYKQRLQRLFTYVLDMPIRMKPGQRPKYRMIHVTNHAQGCILMADNMAARKDELFIDIQNEGQLTLFGQTLENEVINPDDIHTKMELFLKDCVDDISLNKLLASFFTAYGVLCKSGNLIDILKAMQQSGYIKVTRTPSTTPKTGKPSTFFTEGRGQHVVIRRGQS